MTLVVVVLMTIVMLKVYVARANVCGQCICDYEYDMLMTCEGFGVTYYPQLSWNEKMYLEEIRIYTTLIFTLPIMILTEYAALKEVHIMGNILLPCYEVDEWRAILTDMDFNTDCPAPSQGITGASTVSISDLLSGSSQAMITTYTTTISVNHTTLRAEEEEEEEELRVEALAAIIFSLTCLFILAVIVGCIIAKKMRRKRGGVGTRRTFVNGSKHMYREGEGYFENPIFMENLESSV